MNHSECDYRSQTLILTFIGKLSRLEFCIPDVWALFHSWIFVLYSIIIRIKQRLVENVFLCHCSCCQKVGKQGHRTEQFPTPWQTPLNMPLDGLSVKVIAATQNDLAKGTPHNIYTI